MHLKNVQILVIALVFLAIIPLAGRCCAQSSTPDKVKVDKPINSRIEKTESGNLFIIQEVTINAPVKKVWEAYATAEGWRSWVAPVAEVDLKIGGEIRTNYRQSGTTTDADAIILHIVNYVPERVLTLQAEVSRNWPDIMKEQEKHLYNVITFEQKGENKTKLTSYGTGYKDTPEFQKLVKFFVPANEATFAKLIAYVEQGKIGFVGK